MKTEKLRHTAALAADIIAAFAAVLLAFGFLHEGGHAAAALLLGCPILEFSPVGFGAHITLATGSLTADAAPVVTVCGMLLPVLAYLLLPRSARKGRKYIFVCSFAALCAIASAAIWAVTPAVRALAGPTGSLAADDSIVFLESSGASPLALSCASALLTVSLAVHAAADGLPGLLLGALRES